MRLIHFGLLSLIGFVAQTANAQTQTEGDAKVAQLHQEHPELGFMFIDVLVLKNGQWNCKPRVTLTSDTGKKAEVKVFTDDPMLSPIQKIFGGLASLEPAVWTVTSFQCYKLTFNGSIGQVRIGPGEIVNAGHLVVDIITEHPGGFLRQATYRTRAKVEDLNADAKESLARRAPATFAKAKPRYLTVNPKLKWFDTPPAPAQ
jgi:hypothetical protein